MGLGINHPSETRDTPTSAPSAVNADPVLHEIHHALERLAETGEGTVIDLNTLPFGPADMERLDEVLGPGEVEATVDAMGHSRIRETGTAGVWMIEHLDSAGGVQSRFIEVTLIPDILKADHDDVVDASQRLSDRLDEERRPS